MSFKKLLMPLGVFLMLLPMACNEKESDLGLNLQDPTTLFDGIKETAYLSACTVYEDSLLTAGYTSGIFGDWTDENFGKVRSIIYSQINISSDQGISMDESVEIDSVVMTLVLDTVFPVVQDSTPFSVHIIINQLAEPLKSDSAYYSNHTLAESDVCFFDDEVIVKGDTVKMVMRPTIFPVLKQVCSQEDFLKITKGFSLKLADNSNRMLTVDYTATGTQLEMFYHTPTANDLKYVFPINVDAAHCMYYEHDYMLSPVAVIANHTKDSLEGNEALYLEPLGGTRVRLNMQEFLNNFRKNHPTAVIHYAELLLPLNEKADMEQTPKRIFALKNFGDSSQVYITDASVLSNPYTVGGFDGYYHEDKGYYRLRVTRHMQELMRSGVDHGMELIIDSRRSQAMRTVINGTGVDDPVRIEFIYSD